MVEREYREPTEMTNADIVEEFSMNVWVDAENGADDMSPRTAALKEEILRRMRLGQPD